MADPWIPTLLDVVRLFPAKPLALELDCLISAPALAPAPAYDPYPYEVDPALELALEPMYDL